MKDIISQYFRLCIVLFFISGIFLNCSKDSKIIGENYDYLLRKPIGLIIENTEKENDIQIYYGVIKKLNNEYFFTNSNKKVKVSLDSAKLKNSKKISDKMRSEIKSLENCKYAIWMKMGNMEEADLDMKDTGLNWK